MFRLSRYQQFKDFQKRILVATNLFGRGMDIERVNIVFNYDMPEDSDTYLHRVSPFFHMGQLDDQGTCTMPSQYTMEKKKKQNFIHMLTIYLLQQPKSCRLKIVHD